MRNSGVCNEQDFHNINGTLHKNCKDVTMTPVALESTHTNLANVFTKVISYKTVL